MARVWMVLHGKAKRFRSKQRHCNCRSKRKGRPNAPVGMCHWAHRAVRQERKKVNAEMRGYDYASATSAPNA